MNDLIQRLRKLHAAHVERADIGTVFGQAADEIEKLREENRKLEAALEIAEKCAFES